MANATGIPVWFELITPDADAAGRFYGSLAGWTVMPLGNAAVPDYRVGLAPDGEAVAGFLPAGGDVPPGWAIYFAAPDVDAAVAQVTALGGTVHMPPQDIAGVGRIAFCADPQGVCFYLLAESGSPSAAFKAMPGGAGHAVWCELATPDPDAAWAFYGALFGWDKAGAMPMGAMGDYAFIGVGEERPGAIMSSTATGAAAAWSVYFHVSDIDAAVRAIADGGGTVRRGPDQIPGGEYSVTLTDPDGHAVGVVGPRI